MKFNFLVSPGTGGASGTNVNVEACLHNRGVPLEGFKTLTNFDAKFIFAKRYKIKEKCVDWSSR